MKKANQQTAITAEVLVDLYIKQGLPQTVIAARFGVSQGTITNYMRRFGVDTRKKHRKSTITKEELYDLYVVQGLSQEFIGDKLQVSQTVVGDYLKSFGIDTRGVGSPSTVIIQKEELQRLYRDERKSYAELRAHFHCSSSVITKALVGYGILMTKAEKRDKLIARNKKRCAYQMMHKGYEMIRMVDHPAANYNGYVPKHRLVVEEFLGKILPLDVHIHHISSRKTENRIENLAVLPTHRDHMRVHRYGERIGLWCSLLLDERPAPLTFEEPIFWGGRYITTIDLITQGAEEYRRVSQEIRAGQDAAQTTTVN